jgi:hypothetical protein
MHVACAAGTPFLKTHQLTQELSFAGQYVENDLVRAKRPDFDPSILTINSHLMFW